MQVVVFGANGKVGRLVVQELLEQDHKVVAFVHSSSRLPEHPHLHITKGDIHANKDVAQAVKGTNAVISCLGSWGTRSKDILTSGMRNIIPVMKEQNIARIISLTGTDAEASTDPHGLVHRLSRPALMLVAGKILRDGETHIKLLEDSGLNWTVVRSPIMSERGQAKNFELTTARPMPWATINRRSVALALVELIHDDAFSKQAPFIVRF